MAQAHSLVISVVGALLFIAIICVKYLKPNDRGEGRRQPGYEPRRKLSDISDDEGVASQQKNKPRKKVKKATAAVQQKKEVSVKEVAVFEPKGDEPVVDSGVLRMMKKEVVLLVEDKKGLLDTLSQLQKTTKNKLSRQASSDDEDEDEDDESGVAAVMNIQDFTGMNKKTRGRVHKLLVNSINKLKNEIERLNENIENLQKQPELNEVPRPVALTRTEIEEGWSTVTSKTRSAKTESDDGKINPTVTIISSFAYLNDDIQKTTDDSSKNVFSGEEFPEATHTIQYGEKKSEKKKRKSKKQPQQQIVGLTC